MPPLPKIPLAGILCDGRHPCKQPGEGGRADPCTSSRFPFSGPLSSTRSFSFYKSADIAFTVF